MCTSQYSRQQYPGHSRARDVTGAGDAFDAAFLSCRMRGMDLDRSLEFANSAGALCVTARGDVEAIPSVSDVKRFLDGGEHVLR